MTSHDRLFKLLIENDFTSFIETFVPELQEMMKGSTVTWLNKELLRLGPQRKPSGRVVDLVARVTRKGKKGTILIFIEHQAQKASDILGRMHFCAAFLLDQGLFRDREMMARFDAGNTDAMSKGVFRIVAVRGGDRTIGAGRTAFFGGCFGALRRLFMGSSVRGTLTLHQVIDSDIGSLPKCGVLDSSSFVGT